MKKKRSLLLLALFGISVGLVTACGEDTPEPVDPTPDPGEETPEPPTPTPPDEVSEEDYQKEMLGTFYSKEGTVIVTYEELTFEGEETLTLTPTKAEELKEGDETRAAIYYEDDAGNSYRAYLSFGVAQKLVLEALEGTEYEVVTTLSPSIEEFTGAYTYSGDTDEYNYAFSITDTFDPRFDAFIVNYFGYSYYTTTYYYANSYFAEINGELVKVFDLMDYEDEYWYTTYSLDVTDNVATLVDSYEDIYGDDAHYNGDYYSDITYVYCEYFIDNETTLGFDYTPLLDDYGWAAGMADTITFDGEEFDIAYLYDNSQYLHLSNANRELLLRPYAYGIEITENGSSTLYPFNNLIGIDGSYEDSKTSIVSNINGLEPALTVNEVEVTTYAKTVYKNRIALEVTTDTTKFTLVPFVPSVSLTLVDEDGERVLLNYETFEEYYSDLGSINHGTVELYSFTSLDTVIYYNLDNSVPSDPATCTFEYNPRKAFPDLYFTIKGKDYCLELLSTNSGAFRLYEIGTENTKDLFNFDFYVGDIIYAADYHSGKIGLRFNEEFTLTRGDVTDISYALTSVYNPRYFDYDVHVEYTLNGEDRYLLLDPSETLYEYSVDDPTHFITTYISEALVSELVGRYVWDGTYGEESFEFTEDGKFFMDVLNETKDGLVNIESEYALVNMPLANGTFQTAISFPYEDMTIYAYKSETSLDVMGISYVYDFLAPLVYSRIHSENALYELFITKQGKILYEGEEVRNTRVEAFKDENGKYTSIYISFSVSVDGYTSYYNFFGDITYNELGEITYTPLTDSLAYTFEITKYDIEDYLTPTEGLSLDTYTVKVEKHLLLSGMQDGYHVAIYSGDTLVTTIIDFDITSYRAESGSVVEALHATYSTYDFYIYLDADDQVVGEFTNSASSIPTPPPPPPTL